MKVALTGSVQTELLAPYFVRAGFDLARPGERFDFAYDVTAHDEALAREVVDFRDDRLAALAGCPYSLAGIEAIVEEARWFFAARPCKVLAVDADNTLWRGILSEDGRDALVDCREFQAGLRQLAAQGVALVLVSKNDPDSIPLDWFAIKKVNWEPKPGNVIEACRELNLAPDSVVFVDDNPHERAQMAAHLPEVAVAPFAGWRTGDEREQRQLLRRLREYFFSAMGTTAEDRLRVADYAANARRQDAALRFSDKDDYLRDLQLTVSPALATADDLDRLAQMAAKTNQFNATTIRRSRDDFAALVAADRVYRFRAADRFGEQGTVLYVVLDADRRRITDFVMSCRAMGRTLEHFAYEYVARELGFRPTVDFVPTVKNAPFAAFYGELASNPSLKTFYTPLLGHRQTLVKLATNFS